MKKEFKEAIEDSPIIAAIKDDEGLKKCLTSESRVIFILYGDICNIPNIVETVKSWEYPKVCVNLQTDVR